MVNYKMKKLAIMCLLLIGGVHQVAVAKVHIIPESWVGLYNDEQKISLFFEQTGSKLTGYSILNGKKMNFTGSITDTGKLTLTEQGSGAGVGVFNFQYQNALKAMEGSWKSSTGQVKPKFFSVNAQQCRYAKGQGSFPEASTRLLKDADLQMPLGQLQYMRNEIYARHGYAFTNKEWASTFAENDWYMPCYTSVEARLSPIEKQNIQRIKMVEPYAQDIDWGR